MRESASHVPDPLHGLGGVLGSRFLAPLRGGRVCWSKAAATITPTFIGPFFEIVVSLTLAAFEVAAILCNSSLASPPLHHEAWPGP